MDECKCCQCGNDTFWYLLSGEIRCTKCLKTYPNDFNEQIAALTKGLRNVLYQGHNEDCLFCGFKDKIATEALRGGEK